MREPNVRKETPEASLVRRCRRVREDQLSASCFAFIRQLQKQGLEVACCTLPSDYDGRGRCPTSLGANVGWGILALRSVVSQPSLRSGSVRSPVALEQEASLCRTAAVCAHPTWPSGHLSG